MSVYRISLPAEITEEMNDALNLLGMWACVEEGSMTQEEWQEQADKFNEKWGYGG